MADAEDAPGRTLWKPLSLPTIEAKAKSVILDRYFTVRITLTPAQEQDYVKIRGLIASGGDLAPYYRRSLNADRLLKSHQVMHLHLGGSGSDAILYLVQYPENAAWTGRIRSQTQSGTVDCQPASARRQGQAHARTQNDEGPRLGIPPAVQRA